ncbi:MAG: hypothetical protein ACO3SP_08650 [Ilumatobacteraceae bacterium]
MGTFEATTRELETPMSGIVETHRPCRAVTSAVGQLIPPKLPRSAGMNDFDGPRFHSATWPEGLSMEGKRAAVIRLAPGTRTR